MSGIHPRSRPPLLGTGAALILGRDPDSAPSPPWPPIPMLNWFRRRRLSPDARRRIMMIAARSEEALIETHVSNVLELLQALGDEVDLDRGIEIYEETLSLPPVLADTVKTRVLARMAAPARLGASLAGGTAEARPAAPRPRRRGER